jgi:hypothetical protein
LPTKVSLTCDATQYGLERTNARTVDEVHEIKQGNCWYEEEINLRAQRSFHHPHAAVGSSDVMRRLKLLVDLD